MAALDWNATIENDGQQFILLNEGDYRFKVTNFERGRFNGSEKMEPCNKAILTLSVETPEGAATVKTDLILNTLMEWQLSSFFRSIGQKKHNERLVMDWSKIIDAEGYAHFKPRTFKAADGSDKQANNVAYFIDWDELKMAAPTVTGAKKNQEFPF